MHQRKCDILVFGGSKGFGRTFKEELQRRSYSVQSFSRTGESCLQGDLNDSKHRQKVFQEFQDPTWIVLSLGTMTRNWEESLEINYKTPSLILDHYYQTSRKTNFLIVSSNAIRTSGNAFEFLDPAGLYYAQSKQALDQFAEALGHSFHRPEHSLMILRPEFLQGDGNKNDHLTDRIELLSDQQMAEDLIDQYFIQERPLPLTLHYKCRRRRSHFA